MESKVDSPFAKDFSRLPSMWDNNPPNRPDYKHYYDPRFNTKNDRVFLDPKPQPRTKPPNVGKNWSKGQSNSQKGRRKSRANRKQAARLAIRDGGWYCHWCHCELSYDEPVRQHQRYRRVIVDAELANSATPKRIQLAQYPTIDHIVEWAISHDNSDNNCVLSCQPCNNKRSIEFDKTMNRVNNPPRTCSYRTPSLTQPLIPPDFPRFGIAEPSDTP